MQKILIYILLIAVILSACKAQTSEVTPTVPTLTEVSRVAIESYLSLQKDSRISDEDKIKSLVNAYFILRYESQKTLTEQDFSLLLEDTSLDWFQDEKKKEEIELYLACVADLAYQSYDFSLDYIDFQINPDEAIVTLEESHTVVFQVTSPEISGMSGLVHLITLHKKDDQWVIFEDLYEDEHSHMFDFRSKEEIINQIDSNLGLNQDDSKKQSCQRFIK